MASVTVGQAPNDALISGYREKRAFTDCYVVDVPGSVSLAQYIEAFYTTRLFKLERFVLFLIGKASTDADVLKLARGETDRFAAWTVEGRTDNQILMCDFLGKTRSWLMCAPGAEGTRLFFGSVVMPKSVSAEGQASLGSAFRLMLGFHGIYARSLLGAAEGRLRKFRRQGYFPPAKKASP